MRRGARQQKETDAGEASRTEPGLYLYGVLRSSGLWPWRSGLGGEAGLTRVRYRDLAALVCAAPFCAPTVDRSQLLRHQRTVEQANRRDTILPAPAGVVFRGRRPLLRFMQDQYLALDEALSFVEGHWELRVHVLAAGPGEPEVRLREVANLLYGELRRSARAAIPFPCSGRRLLSAAFLVERNGWVGFVERVEDMGVSHPDLSVDVTGPWPPYDFVRMTV